jgi:hypothetical protein
MMTASSIVASRHRTAQTFQCRPVIAVPGEANNETTLLRCAGVEIAPHRGLQHVHTDQ